MLSAQASIDLEHIPSSNYFFPKVLIKPLELKALKLA